MRTSGDDECPVPTGRPVRPSAPALATSSVLSPERLAGPVGHTADTATVRAGMLLHDLGAALHEVGRGLPVARRRRRDRTGTHGTGKRLHSFSSMVLVGRLVMASGEVVQVDDGDPELLWASRTGRPGVFTELTIRVRPAFRLRRREWCVRTDDCLAHLDELVDRNRMFDSYWHPRRDERSCGRADLEPVLHAFGGRPHWGRRG